MLKHLLILGVLAGSGQAAPPALCNSAIAGPFVVTSGAPFNVTWLVPSSTSENGVTVPVRINGFYIQIDGGTKDDIGMATELTQCPSSGPFPLHQPYTTKTSTGVARGNHTLKISSWNFSLDATGTPTTTKQESVVASVPFTAGDPIMFGPPPPPVNIVIMK